MMQHEWTSGQNYKKCLWILYSEDNPYNYHQRIVPRIHMFLLVHQNKEGQHVDPIPDGNGYPLPAYPAGFYPLG
jgi:hypothetical protein